MSSLDRDLPIVKNIQVRDSEGIETLENALEAAKNEEGVDTDRDAVVELAEAYTGWSA